MYTLTQDDVLLVGAELATLDSDRSALAILIASQIVASPDAWGGDAKAKTAATYLAAHLEKLMLIADASKPGVLPSGAIQSVTVGPVTKSFFQLGPNIREEINAGLSLTLYGVTFLGLKRMFSFSRFVVLC